MSCIYVTFVHNRPIEIYKFNVSFVFQGSMWLSVLKQPSDSLGE